MLVIQRQWIETDGTRKFAFRAQELNLNLIRRFQSFEDTCIYELTQSSKKWLCNNVRIITVS